MTQILKIATLAVLLLFGFITTEAFLINKNIDRTDIKIRSTTGGTEVHLGSTKADVITAFGTPTSVEKFYFETIDKHGEVVHYNSNDLDFVDNKLISFEIKTSTYTVGFTSGNFTTIGSSSSTVPSSAVKTADKAVLNITIQNNNADESLIYLFDASNNIIGIRYASN